MPIEADLDYILTGKEKVMIWSEAEMAKALDTAAIPLTLGSRIGLYCAHFEKNGKRYYNTNCLNLNLQVADRAATKGITYTATHHPEMYGAKWAIQRDDSTLDWESKDPAERLADMANRLAGNLGWIAEKQSRYAWVVRKPQEGETPAPQIQIYPHHNKPAHLPDLIEGDDGHFLVFESVCYIDRWAWRDGQRASMYPGTKAAGEYALYIGPTDDPDRDAVLYVSTS